MEWKRVSTFLISCSLLFPLILNGRSGRQQSLVCSIIISCARIPTYDGFCQLSYKWTQRQKIQHRIDLINIAFLYLPRISERFKEDYINKGQNHIFQYNYQDRLIINMGYSYNYNSVGGSIINNTIASNSYSIRFNFESAGNVMYALSKAANIRKNSNGEYAILGIPYAQYLKGEFDFAKNIRIDYRNSFAFHAGVGIAVPYGNAKTIPFEKQYFSGGANSVRGWSVRDLGPGSFAGNGNLLDQSGDIKLDASIEYRSKLFWKFQGRYLLMLVISGPSGVMPINREGFSSLIGFISK